MAKRRPIDFQEVKRQLTVPQVLQSRGWRWTERQGRQMRGPCPVHGSRSPDSRTLAVTDDGWFCHKCQRGGDVIRLVQELDGLDAYDAAKQLVERFDLHLQLHLF